VRKKLRKKKTGVHPVTIKDMARRAGVSVATISRGLRDDPGISAVTRKRIKALAAKVSYTPSRWGAALSSGRTRCILFVVPYDPAEIPQSNLIYVQALEGAAEELAAFGYSIEVVLEKSLRSRKENVLEAITNSRVDGAIIVCMNVDDALSKFKIFPVPVVVVNQVFKSESVDFVVADDRHGAFLATEHLIQSGHLNIAHIGGPLQYYGSRERRAGYIDALSANGLSFDPKKARETFYTMQHGYDAAKSLLESGTKFSAIFSSGDILSAGIIAALREHKLRVPEDISIASYDDEVLAAIISPPLTTVRKPRHAMGKTAASILLERIRSNPGGKGRIVELMTTLVKRESVAGFVKEKKRQRVPKT
jgi:DNA-binding LacI/PurR family transcriptional regulator